MKLENRTFIVSGGSSGLGLATVQMLVQAKAYVSILDRAPPPSELISSQVKFYETDITVVSQIEKAVEETVNWTKQTGAVLRGVVNSAGVAAGSKIIDAQNEPHSLDLWEFVLAVNLTGTFNLTRIALKHMVRSEPEDNADGERGVIILVSSSAAYEAQPGQVAYSASKGALRSMAMPLARDLARHSIRVMAIAPNMFISSMTDKLPPRARKSLEDALTYPRRFGQPVEFAETVKWILECAYVNGETVRLSGESLVLPSPAKLHLFHYDSSAQIGS
ncbi:hypothetical protein GYMLUDRAFT_165638 [Collybiopsis luxurians FD-317 M1]|uniref:Ketoreductase domain-containing protein n=1 Tax=Collybiopsis luxurians FD-317 M1 TaxID=944289 RepID=A0A0D0BE58_9AGAR|nr:hypothetical protein GYMLUDRAFT_165638 [Collybiopsis luxurians FD-317 M1]